MCPQNISIKKLILLLSCIFFTIFNLCYYQRVAGNNSVNFEVYYGIIDNKLPKCAETYDNINTNVTVYKRKTIDLDNAYPMVEHGGSYKPMDCTARHKVAILVPFRNRHDNLNVFLYNIHPFLMRQKLEYRIFVIEQNGREKFNRGSLFNAGFLEIEKMGEWQCVVFHDVDLLPTDNRIRYSCPSLPRHMCATVVENDEPKPSVCSVTAMTMEQFRLVNGYSNFYWGWGGEDEDMLKRLMASGFDLSRYKKNIGRYTSLLRLPDQRNYPREAILKRAIERYKLDGLNNIVYKKLCETSHHLYTRIVVDIHHME